LRPFSVSPSRQVIAHSRIQWFLLAGVSLFFCVVVELIGRGKLLWFDELATLSTANQPTWHRLLQAEVVDANPPIVYLLTRISLHLFGLNQFALRLPELSGILLAGVCCFLFVRRALDWPSGLLAASMLFFGHAYPYAIEGRPYGLLTGFSALMLVCWQAAARGKIGHRTAALCGLAFSGLAVNLTHPYGVLYAFFPILAAEATRCYRNHRLDWPVIGCYLAGFSGQILALPLAMQTRHSLLGDLPPGGIPVAFPTLFALRMSVIAQLRSIPCTLVLPFILVGLCVAWTDREQVEKQEADPFWNELAAAAGLASMLVLVWCFSKLVTHYYFDRYGTPASAGVAMLAVLLLRRIPGRTATVFALTFGIVSQVFLEFRPAMRGRQVPLDRYLFDRSIPDKPVLVSSALAFSQQYWYADVQQRQRLHFVGDAKRALQMGDFIPELNIIERSQRGLLPYHPEKLDDFLAQHKSFLMLSDRHYLSDSSVPADEWVPDELHRRGYHFVTLLDHIPGYDASIEEVTAPEQASTTSN
jgi:hypothetical protein